MNNQIINDSGQIISNEDEIIQASEDDEALDLLNQNSNIDNTPSIEDSQNTEKEFSRKSFPVVIGLYSKDSSQDQKKENFFLILKDGKPIKIGDGSFGAVFAIEDSRRNPYALKILYDRNFHVEDEPQVNDSIQHTKLTSKLTFAITKERFEKEADSMLRINQTIRKQKIDLTDNTDIVVDNITAVGNITSIVDQVGYTTEFPEVILSEYFVEKLKLKLSKYALVTERYEGTLKDLLEEPRQKGGKTGYDLLKNLNFEGRLKTILPFIINIANGLRIMHAAGYVHLDIKPANVFWRRKNYKDIDVAIGDLGYIRNIDEEDSVISDAKVAYGTLHYRSPEQRDFKDTCEIKIDRSDDHGTWLVTDDPKFFNTIVGKGDNLLFQSDLSRYFKIKEILPDKETGKTTILIENKSLGDIEESGPNIEESGPTQVVIYKNQGIRSDLFGFGAIIYDLITCGQSPERYYSTYLVAEDSRGGNEDAENSVNNIMGMYERISINYSTSDQRYSRLFSPFQSQNAPEDIVSLILKCMLYQAKGTYYQENKDDKKAFKDIVKRLEELNKKYPQIDSVYDNPLTCGYIIDALNGLGQSLQYLTKDLEAIRSIQVLTEKKSTLFTRICFATFRFLQLIRLLRRKCSIETKYINKDEEFFFAELSPENIKVISDRLDFNYPTYRKLRDYINDLSSDTVYNSKILHNPVNPFSPAESVGYLRRKIRLCKSSEDNRYEYNFLESSILGDTIKENDWIVALDNKDNKVMRVKEVSENTLTLTSSTKDQDQERNNNSRIILNQEKDCCEYIYHRNLDLFSYYLSVLGVYLYQFFFVGIQSNTISESDAVRSLRAQLSATPKLAPDVHQLLKEFLEKRIVEDEVSSNNLSNLYCKLAALYLILVLPHQKEYFKRYSENQNPIESLLVIWDNIGREIASILGLPSGFFNNPDDNIGHFSIEAAETNKDQLKISEIQGKLENIEFDTKTNFNVVYYIQKILKSKWDVLF
jgi:serine/threonine protein kinase